MLFSNNTCSIREITPKTHPKRSAAKFCAKRWACQLPIFFLSYNGEENVGERKAQSSLFVVSFVLALNKAHVLAHNTAHVLRLNKADVLALNKAHVLRLNTKTCPVFTANTKETTKGGGRRPPPFVEAAEGRLLCVGCEHLAYLSVETPDMCLVEKQGICLVETQDMCCVESLDMRFTTSK